MYENPLFTLMLYQINQVKSLWPFLIIINQNFMFISWSLISLEKTYNTAFFISNSQLNPIIPPSWMESNHVHGGLHLKQRRNTWANHECMAQDLYLRIQDDVERNIMETIVMVLVRSFDVPPIEKEKEKTQATDPIFVKFHPCNRDFYLLALRYHRIVFILRCNTNCYF